MQEFLEALVAGRGEPLGAVVGVRFSEVEESLALGDFGWDESHVGGEGVAGVGGFVGGADVCPAIGVGDLGTFGLGGALLFAHVVFLIDSKSRLCHTHKISYFADDIVKMQEQGITQRGIGIEMDGETQLILD